MSDGVISIVNSDEVAYLRTQLQLLADEVKRLRLTARERAAITEAIVGNEQDVALFGDKAAKADAKALRGLLERHHSRELLDDRVNRLNERRWMPLPEPPTN